MAMKKVSANSNLKKDETDKGYLIKLPKTDYLFWHPRELVSFSGKKDYLMTIHYSDNSLFTVFRYGRGLTTSKKIIEEKELSVAEFEEFF